MIGLVEKKREELTLTITERERKHMIGRKKWDTYVCVCVCVCVYSIYQFWKDIGSCCECWCL